MHKLLGGGKRRRLLSHDRQAVFREADPLLPRFRHESGPCCHAYPEPFWPQGSGPFSLSPDGKSLLAVRVDPSNSDTMLVTPFR